MSPQDTQTIPQVAAERIRILAQHCRQLTLLIFCRFNTRPGAHTPPLTQTLVTQEIIIKKHESDRESFFFFPTIGDKISTLFLKKGIIQNWHKQKETCRVSLAPQLLAFQLQQIQGLRGCSIAFQGAGSSVSQQQTCFTWNDKDGLLLALKEGQHQLRTWGPFIRGAGSPDQNNPEFFSGRDKVCYVACLGRAGGSLLIHSLIIAS